LTDRLQLEVNGTVLTLEGVDYLQLEIAEPVVILPNTLLLMGVG
jgi:hypothetical protein